MRNLARSGPPLKTQKIGLNEIETGSSYRNWMTLDQRRRRLRLGVGICAVAMAALIVAALAGVERHITLFSSMPLWPFIGVLAGQLTRVHGRIAVHGPDQLEEPKPASRKAIAAGLCALIVVLAIGSAIAVRAPALLASQSH